MPEKSNVDDVINEIKRLETNVQKISKMQNELVVKDGQFINISNLRKKKVLSRTDEEARHEARYNDARDNKPFNEEGIPVEEQQKAEKEIVDRYVRDFLDNMLSITPSCKKGDLSGD
jgi:hypothetical protein